MPTPEPTDAQRAKAKLIVAKRSNAEAIALQGNWRPVKVPPLLEFVRRLPDRRQGDAAISSPSTSGRPRKRPLR